MAVATVMLFAGKANAQITLHAGYQHMTVSASGDGVTVTSTNGANGFYVGGDYSIDLGVESLAIAPGAMFSYIEDMIDLRVPVLFTYSKPFDNITLGVFAGPVFNIGLAGKMYDDPIKTKRFDIALNGGLWVGYQQFRLDFGYSYGLLNRFDDSNITWNFNKIYIGLGYSL